MRSDIVERLRLLADCDARAGEPLGHCMREAADEIARLRAIADAAKAETEAEIDWNEANGEFDMRHAHMALQTARDARRRAVTGTGDTSEATA